jgi:S1-C subfamily serine protease
MVDDDESAPITTPSSPGPWVPPSSVPPTPPPGGSPTPPPLVSPFAPPATSAPALTLPSSPPLIAPTLGGAGFGAPGFEPTSPGSVPGFTGFPPGSVLPYPPAYGGSDQPLPDLPTRVVPPGVGMTRGRRTLLAVALLSAVLASLLTAGLVLALDWGRPSSSSSSSSSAPAGNSQLANRAGLDIQGLLRKAQPSVVSIQTGQTSSAGVFGAAGSGVVISDDGLVLTNAHVIESATTMQVTLSDGRSVSADLVGSLPSDDVALIRLRDPGSVTPAELGNSADVQVGDDVVAIGNALNLGGPPSVTEGIISAKDRTIQAGSETLRNLIQTDAAINPGNSGGPLLNGQGQVVGINTAIISDAQNIGFAIAIDSIKPLIQEIKAGKGAVTKDTAFLGVSTQSLGDISSTVRDQYAVRTTDGAFVTDIAPDSAASDAGLQLGDVVTAIDGQPITSSQDVVDTVQSHQPGDQIVITYERSGQTRNVTVELRAHGG